MTTTLDASPTTLSDVDAVADGILCDILVPTTPVGFDEELETRIKAGFSMISLSMAGDTGATPAAIYSGLASMRRRLSLKSGQIAMVDTVADIRAARQAGKLAINFHFQGSEAVGRDLANVEAYYKLGVRWMLMAYNFQNNVGTGCLEAQTNDIGLSRFGKQLVVEMNRVGMLVDCSHSGYRTTMDAMATSSQPCIFSHSNPRALYDHPRNIRDDQIKALAETGGVIGVNGVGAFIGEPKEVTIGTIVKQIDYIANLVGPQYIAFGFDYMTEAHCQAAIAHYGDNTMESIGLSPELPWGFLHPGSVPALLAELLDRGYSAEDVRGIMGENFLRVAEAVWR